MSTVILVRHGKSTANGSGVLAGRSPKVNLDDTGRGQAEKLVERLDGVPLAGVVVSPMLRCKQTVAPLLAARGIEKVVEPGLSEVDYGDWTGKELKHLAKEPLWRVVQAHASAAVFPGGEGLAQMQARSVAAVRAHDRRIAAEHGDHAVWLLCSHGDVIKSIIADALGQHLDAFQRIVVDPSSISVVRYTETRPFVLRVNDHSADLSGIVPPAPKPAKRGKKAGKDAASSDAVVGGTTGR
ncbi:histidine phosphatase family protein [Amycolatopsis sp. NPDC088138]|uniref:histidine phosphatase family protein n=1 Tax=Amycolatopsis sp. NPDC088138 TaxID=3363938 RepID=UPI00382345E1